MGERAIKNLLKSGALVGITGSLLSMLLFFFSLKAETPGFLGKVLQWLGLYQPEGSIAWFFSSGLSTWVWIVAFLLPLAAAVLTALSVIFHEKKVKWKIRRWVALSLCSLFLLTWISLSLIKLGYPKGYSVEIDGTSIITGPFEVAIYVFILVSILIPSLLIWVPSIFLHRKRPRGWTVILGLATSLSFMIVLQRGYQRPDLLMTCSWILLASILLYQTIDLSLSAWRGRRKIPEIPEAGANVNMILLLTALLTAILLAFALPLKYQFRPTFRIEPTTPDIKLIDPTLFVPVAIIAGALVLYFIVEPISLAVRKRISGSSFRDEWNDFSNYMEREKITGLWPIRVLGASLLVLIVGYALTAMCESRGLVDLDQGINYRMGLFLMFTGTVLVLANLPFAVLSPFPLGIKKVDYTVTFRSRKRRYIPFMIAKRYHLLVRRITEWLQNEELFSVWWSRFSLLVLAGLSFWSIGIALERTDYISYMEDTSGFDMGLYFSFITVATVMLPISIFRFFLSRKRWWLKWREPLAAIALTFIFVLLYFGLFQPFGKVEYEVYLFYVNIHLDKLWVLFGTVGSLLWWSMTIKGRTSILRSLLWLVSPIALFVLLRQWNDRFIHVIENETDTFGSHWMPYTMILVPLVIGILYLVMFEVLNPRRSNNKKAEEGPYSLLDTDRRKRMKMILLDDLRVGFPILMVGILLVPISLTSLEHDRWHGYTSEEDWPEGEDRKLAEGVLSEDLGTYMEMERFENGYIYHPNFVDMETLEQARSHYEKMKSGEEWGHYYLGINVEVSHNRSVRIDNHWYESRWNRDDSGFETNMITGSVNMSFHDSENGYGDFLYLDLGDFGGMLHNDEGKESTCPKENFTRYINNSIMIHVSLSLGEQTAPLAGYGVWFDQYVVLQEDEIACIAVNRGNWIS